MLDILKLLPLCQARSSKFTMIVQNVIRRCQFVCVWSIRHLDIPLVPITNGLQVCSAYYIKSMSLPSIMTFWPLTIMLSCLIRTPSLYLGGNITRELWWDVILLWYPVWIYMYLKVGTTHVFRLALCNFVLGLTIHNVHIDYLWTSLFKLSLFSLRVYKARFYLYFFSGFICLLKLC